MMPQDYRILGAHGFKLREVPSFLTPVLICKRGLGPGLQGSHVHPVLQGWRSFPLGGGQLPESREGGRVAGHPASGFHYRCSETSLPKGMCSLAPSESWETAISRRWM